MSEKKFNRINRKKAKMAALINLTSTKTHEQLIQELEEQMGGNSQTSSDNLKRPHNSDSEEDCSTDANVYSAYRKLLNKKRKIDEARKLVKIYIDQPFLSECRRKSLLYNENAPELTSPIALHACGVQQLIMYNLFGRNSMYRPRWCSVQYVTSVTQILVILVESVSWLDVKISLPAAWPHTNHLFADQSVRMVSSSLYDANVEEDLFMVPLTPSEVANTLPKPSSKHSARHNTDRSSTAHTADGDRIDMELDINALLQAKDAFSRTMLLLSFTDLTAEGYPLPTQSCDLDSVLKDFEFSQASYKRVTESSPMYALDCEMVMTSDCRWSLASVCVVDEKLNVVYKSLVKPDLPITDYLTKFSGMTAPLLKDVTTNLKDVQKELRRLLPADAILCGQSLNSDLVALKLYHPYVIDTSVCYNLKGMPHSKTGLKKLAAHFLRKDIQCGDSGHCPEEDARTTMELILLKLKIGYTFANALTDGPMTTPSKFFKHVSAVQEDKSITTATDNKCNSNIVGPATELDNSPSADHSAEGADSATPAVERVVSATPGAEGVDSETPSVKMLDSATPSIVPTATNTDPTNQLIDSPTEISQLAAFSRCVIPQLEVNMFDLLGHHDKKEAVICTNCLKMKKPQNSGVTVCESRKTKHVIENSKNALRSGTDLVYCNMKAKKKSKTSASACKKYALQTDENIAELWDCLKPGGLLCMVLTGNVNHHGAFMFGVKSHTKDTEAIVNEEDGDVYSSVYNYQ